MQVFLLHDRVLVRSGGVLVALYCEVPLNILSRNRIFLGLLNVLTAVANIDFESVDKLCFEVDRFIQLLEALSVVVSRELLTLKGVGEVLLPHQMYTCLLQPLLVEACSE